jgi:hypothetical protein
MTQASVSRRLWLKSSACGFGYMALASMATQQAQAAVSNPLAVKQPHFTPRAKRIIFLCMRGGPTHVDTFDYKPALARDHGKSVALDRQGNAVVGNGGRKLLRSPWKFKPSGKSGLPISELFPHLSKHADDLCLINSMQTSVPNHPQAFLMLHTGEFRFTRPSMGAWLLYGLGSENQNLPGFITIRPPSELGGAQNYGNAFLPAAYQATRIGEEGGPLNASSVTNLVSNLAPGQQRRQLELLNQMNQDLLSRQQVNPELEGVINSFELGFRMQNSLPELMNISSETQQTRDMYGIGQGATDRFGHQCLLARRFIEAGVRFVEIGHSNWDTHSTLVNRVGQLTREIDQPMGALLTDLKQRGLLEDTLVMWGGEFGRTPHAGREDGRDHNSTGFSMWLAGGGVKGGIRYGATDEHGIAAVENPMHHHDLHATIMHLMGIDHQKLSYRYGGRDYTLTDIHGKVAHGLMK